MVLSSLAFLFASDIPHLELKKLVTLKHQLQTKTANKSLLSWPRDQGREAQHGKTFSNNCSTPAEHLKTPASPVKAGWGAQTPSPSQGCVRHLHISAEQCQRKPKREQVLSCPLVSASETMWGTCTYTSVEGNNGCDELTTSLFP